MSVRTAFDADVLICAASKGHPLGSRVRRLFAAEAGAAAAGIGSVLLLTETLAKPMRDNPDSAEVRVLLGLLGRLTLLPCDAATARLALTLSIAYGLRGADAAHLATAVAGGADRFLTNNRKDFSRDIREIDIVYPEDLPEAV